MRGRLRAARGRSWPYAGIAIEVAPHEQPPVPPTFVGVGAQKCGTSWWHALIEAHPDVHVDRGRPKELHYFDRYWSTPFSDDDIAGYLRWFARPHGTVAGEWTPRYLHDPWVAPMLARCAPEASILVLLRDPLDRFRSGITHDLARGAPQVPLVADDAFARSTYAASVRSYQAHFGVDRVLVLQYERCCVDPGPEISRTYEHLGLDPSFRPSELLATVAATQDAKPALPALAKQEMVERWRDDAAQLVKLVPDLDLHLWPSVC